MAHTKNVCMGTETGWTAQLANGALTREEIVDAQLERIALREHAIQAWSWHNPSSVRNQLAALPAHSTLPLAGVTIAVKDLIDTVDMPTEYGSAAYRGHQPEADAGVVTILKAAGALMMGKTVTTEFAHSHAGPTVNPHHLDHTPGGSSSGSAAAVADGMVSLALGTQTGGSVIRPAAYCGVVGFKPTLGRIPLAGVMPLSFSMDTLGMMARSVPDVMLLTNVLLGQPDEMFIKHDTLRFAYYPGPNADEADRDALQSLEAAKNKLQQSGVEIVPIELSHGDFAALGRANRTLMAYEAARQHQAIYHSRPELLGSSTAALIEEGLKLPREQYLQALSHTVYCRRMFNEQMSEIDVVMTLSAPGQAPLYKEGTGASTFNRTWTTIGAPCLTLPAGVGAKGLPLGVQFVGKIGQDHLLLEIGQRFESLLKG